MASGSPGAVRRRDDRRWIYSGLHGAVVAPDGVVVYGTRDVYPTYVGATVWHPPPDIRLLGGGLLHAMDGLDPCFMAVGGAWYVAEVSNRRPE